MPKTEHQNFEELGDPTMSMLEYLATSKPNLTVGHLCRQLEDLEMTRALQIISNSEKGWSLSDYMIVIMILYDLDLQEFRNT